MNEEQPRVPAVSLVTVTYNSAEALKQFWASWPRDSAEWIVVDNQSTDGSAGLAQELGARVVILPTNVGFSAANNFGASLATGQVVGFVNPDVAVTADGINDLARLALDSGALVAPQLMNPDGSLQENGRGAPYPHRKVAHMFFPDSKSNQRYVRHVEQGLERVVWVMGAAVFMAREVFSRIEGWDPGFFIYYEDSDICLRALEAGVSTHVAGDVKWVHGWGRETAKSASAAVWKHEFRSAAHFYRVHPYCVVPLGRKARVMKAVEAARPGGARG